MLGGSLVICIFLLAWTQPPKVLRSTGAFREVQPWRKISPTLVRVKPGGKCSPWAKGPRHSANWSSASVFAERSDRVVEHRQIRGVAAGPRGQTKQIDAPFMA